MNARETELIKKMQKRGGYSEMPIDQFNETIAAVQKLDDLSKEAADNLGLTMKEYMTPGKAKTTRERLIRENIELKNQFADLRLDELMLRYADELGWTTDEYLKNKLWRSQIRLMQNL